MLRAYTLIAALQSFIDDRFEGRKDRGATAVEYGLLVGLIAVVIIVAVMALGDTLQGLFGNVEETLDKVPATGGPIGN